eukprot:5461901-Prymnesium_polylepis.1
MTIGMLKPIQGDGSQWYSLSTHERRHSCGRAQRVAARDTVAGGPTKEVQKKGPREQCDRTSCVCVDVYTLNTQIRFLCLGLVVSPSSAFRPLLPPRIEYLEILRGQRVSAGPHTTHVLTRAHVALILNPQTTTHATCKFRARAMPEAAAAQQAAAVACALAAALRELLVGAGAGD